MAIKPATTKGTRDFSSKEIARRNFIKNCLQNVFENFGFQPIETPTFERLETLTGVYGEEGDRLVFKVLNSGEKVKKADLAALAAGDYQKFSRSLSEKALRYDLTVPFARYVAQHQNELSFPFRRYQIQPVWRADRPQHGRFQEFYQCDVDILGDRSLWQEVEMLTLYDQAFSDLGIKGVTLKINHRKILAAMATLLQAGDRLSAFTVAMDKMDKIGREGVLEELKNNDFSEEALHTLETVLNIRGSAQEKLQQLEPLLLNQPEGREGLNEMKFILDSFKMQPLQNVHLEFDLTLARGLHYYTGMIVEVAAPAEVKMGSIGGGGRYDDLTATFGLKDMSGIGISFGFERIYLVMEALELFPPDIEKSTQLLFLNFDEAAVQRVFPKLLELRNRGISTELYPTAAKLKKQLNYADQKKIPWVVLIGSTELEKEEFVLKNMNSGEQTPYPLSDLVAVLKDKIIA